MAGAHWTLCLCASNGPRTVSGQRIFDPFLTHFCFKNSPISRHFGMFHGPKHVTTGSKRAKNSCFSIPNGLGSLLKKQVIDPFLTHFWSPNGPFSKHFEIFHGPDRITTGSKRPENTCLGIPDDLRSLWGKRNFCPFLTHVCSQNGLFSKHFGIFHGPKRVISGSKRARKTCLSIPNVPASLLEKCVLEPFLTRFLVLKQPIFKTFCDFPWPQPRHHGLKVARTTFD